jgi:hypothetical protein
VELALPSPRGTVRRLIGSLLSLVAIMAVGLVAGSALPTAPVAWIGVSPGPYNYDNAAQASSATQVRPTAKGEIGPSRLTPAVSVGDETRLGEVSRFAAEDAGARFVVNSAGETTMYLRAGSDSLEVTDHAALRLTQRGISIDQAEATLGKQPFQYYYKGAWQTGYYDSSSKIFIGSVDGRITTVINNVNQNYINNLLAATP